MTPDDVNKHPEVMRYEHEFMRRPQQCALYSDQTQALLLSDQWPIRAARKPRERCTKKNPKNPRKQCARKPAKKSQKKRGMRR